MAAPTTSPRPVMLMLPAGMPAECNAWATTCLCNALNLLGWVTVGQPAAITAASLPQIVPALPFVG